MKRTQKPEIPGLVARSADPQQGKLIAAGMGPSIGLFPNDPRSAMSYGNPAPSPTPYDPISYGRVVARSPYGDHVMEFAPQGSVIVEPTPAANRIVAPDPLPGSDRPPWAQQPENTPLNQATESYAMGSPVPMAPQQLGTNFSVYGSGRDTPPPGKAKA